MSSSASQSRKFKKHPKRRRFYVYPKIFAYVGICSILLGLVLVLRIYYPVILAEARYSLRTFHPLDSRTQSQNMPIQPVDRNFGIVIPKIGASAKIIPSVDPNNSNEYQKALTKGVAHAKGTALPDGPGNMFLFSHSSTDLFNALRYNSVFFLMHKLEVGDEIQIYFHDTLYTYKIFFKQIVKKNEVGFLTKISNQPIVTLMTCWPPGTDAYRLIVQGTQKQ